MSAAVRTKLQADNNTSRVCDSVNGPGSALFLTHQVTTPDSDRERMNESGHL